MSGHSKWASIKHKKGALDAKRGRLFTRLLKEIQIAARMGGGNQDGNPRLRTAVQAARDANMPKDNIERAIRKGTGEEEGTNYEDFVFEAYGPGGVAIIIEGTSDNKNRTTPEIRHIFTKHGGKLGELGSVSYNFSKNGVINIPAEGVTEDQLMEAALDAGADDVITEEGMFQVKTSPEAMLSVREAIEAKGIKVESAEVQNLPKSTIRVEGKDAEKLLKLLQALEEHDDVSKVAANFDIDVALIEQMA
jgi:YebC/PmpR family DNA-binding regulatory protein